MSELKAAYDRAAETLKDLEMQERGAMMCVVSMAEMLIAMYPNDTAFGPLRNDVQKLKQKRDAYNAFLRDVYAPAMDAYFEPLNKSAAARAKEASND